MGGLRFATAVNSGNDPRVLATIAMEGVSLALWNRGLPETLATWLASLSIETLPRFEGRIEAGQLATRIRVSNPAAAFGTGAAFAEEIGGLAQIASEIFASRLFEVKLGPAYETPQRGWQLDAATARLRCSFLGPGFEYGLLSPLGEASMAQPMGCGTVCMFRGALWPGTELAAIVHRPLPLAG